jgi:UDP-N-acetylmuramate dehydrogenase
MNHQPMQQNVPLADQTTLRVGGTARYFVEVDSIEELRKARRFAKQTAVPFFVLGSGSNILLGDGLLDYLVIKMAIKGITYEATLDGHTLVKASAGEDWDNLVSKTVENGLQGLENLSGVPGTVGASPVQNINCYGSSVAEVIESVEVYDMKSDEIRILTTADCRFGYRDSIFKQPAGEGLVVTTVTYKLMPAGKVNLSYRSASQSIERYLSAKGIASPTPADVREAILQVRSNIGMLAGQYRSAGSFFKNTIVSLEQFAHIKAVVEMRFAELDKKLSPWYWEMPNDQIKISTAFLLECSPYNKSTYGEKLQHQVVGISPKHSLSIVTYEGATSVDVQIFVQEIISTIEKIFNVTIETEVNFIL